MEGRKKEKQSTGRRGERVSAQDEESAVGN